MYEMSELQGKNQIQNVRPSEQCKGQNLIKKMMKSEDEEHEEGNEN
jgi:hypothetical protein